MPLFELKRARFWDEKGDPHGTKSFKKNDTTFQYADGAYNVDYLNSSYIEDYPFLFPFIARRRTYIYNLGNSNPIKIDKKAEPPISPRLYNINLETRVAQVLNDLSKRSSLDFLKDPKVIIGLLAVIGIIVFFASGGSLTGLTAPAS